MWSVMSGKRHLRLLWQSRSLLSGSRPLSTAVKYESFLSGTNSVYVEEMHEKYVASPSSVPASWRVYFETLYGNKDEVPDYINEQDLFHAPTCAVPPASAGPPKPLFMNPAMATDQTPSDSLGVAHLIRAYQVNGHFAAQLDPLELHSPETFPFRPRSIASAAAHSAVLALDDEEGVVPTTDPVSTIRAALGEFDFDNNANYPTVLTPEYHGFGPDELDRQLNLRGTSSGGNKGFLEELASSPTKVTLRQILHILRKTYCRTLGVEYMHIGDSAKCNWIRERIENPVWQYYDKDKKTHIYERLVFADLFEKFLAHKFNTSKRFGLDGGEAVVPGLKDAIDRASELGAHSFVIGMPHRGRLNILANVMRKPMPLIFSEFAGTNYKVDPELEDSNPELTISGDVKYHLGSSMDRTYPDGRRIHLSLLANPSHLECVDPLVIGKSRAKQYYAGDKPQDIKNVVPIMLHGDAAFAGQGVVYETMQLAGVPDFNTGGTIHVVVNNQIGFTTNPIHSRSTPYCSDIGKAFNCPIFHCNGDDPLAVCAAFETAVEYRHEWGTDVILDIVCYRRNGHNELDQPAFTQPKLYRKINRHPTTLQIFEKRLIQEGTLTKEECDEIKQFAMTSYENDFEASKTYVKKEEDWLSSRWAGFKGPSQQSRIRPTGVDIELLRRIGIQSGTVPSDFKLHRQMAKIFKSRRDMATEGKNIDWGLAEALAFGSLLVEGNHVRITGQDVQRGTFSHRHATVKDQRSEEEYVPLNHLAEHTDPSAPIEARTQPNTQAGFTCRNSILSEFAVLGFELGYSLENPNALVLWEAQFGDFVNGAQIIIDQFISSGEDKWLRQSGLVMLLPHGYDGQGAEHSSCRVERLLQLTDEDSHKIPPLARDQRMQIQHTNWQVVNCTTPANYFHCLRRQIHRDFRKPLIVVSPKNLLRNKLCVSTLEEMGPGTEFQRVFQEHDPEITNNPDRVKTLVYCSGQIYYELLTERERLQRTDIALVRLEQIAPFPFDRVAQAAAKYNSAEVVWAQQEPKNMGAYAYVTPRIMTATRELNGTERRPRYVGRKVSAAPATGMAKVHQLEYQKILEGVFGKETYKV
jgi:2-oxoglutarate dehydrogenase E1 component